MDQMAAACADESKLLALLCQPAELQGTIALPDDLALSGLDSACVILSAAGTTVRFARVD